MAVSTLRVAAVTNDASAPAVHAGCAAEPPWRMSRRNDKAIASAMPTVFAPSPLAYRAAQDPIGPRPCVWPRNEFCGDNVRCRSDRWSRDEVTAPWHRLDATYSRLVFVAYFAAFAMALCYGISAVAEDRAAKRRPITGRGGKRAAFRVTVSVGYLAGMGVSVVAWVFSLIALHRLPLFAVQAIAASSIGVVVLLTSVITHHRPSKREGILLCLLAVALVVLAVSAAPTGPKPVTWVFKLFVWLGVLAVAGAAVRATRVVGARGGALLGAVSGLSDGGMALCARALHHSNLKGLVTDPLALALIPFTIIGIVSFAASLQRGTVSVTVACQQAIVTVVPSVIGLLVLGDTARPGFGVLTYAGFGVTVLVVLALTFTTAAVPPPLVAPGMVPPGTLRHVT
jgi:hypothetical protein